MVLNFALAVRPMDLLFTNSEQGRGFYCCEFVHLICVTFYKNEMLFNLLRIKIEGPQTIIL